MENVAFWHMKPGGFREEELGVPGLQCVNASGPHLERGDGFSSPTCPGVATLKSVVSTRVKFPPKQGRSYLSQKTRGRGWDEQFPDAQALNSQGLGDSLE
jgi:hypothetical protein